MPPPIADSSRCRNPLIMVVVCEVLPAVVFLMVILKSPVIGLSPVSRVLCANEIAVIVEMLMMMKTKRVNLIFISKPLVWLVEMVGRLLRKLSKTPELLNRDRAPAQGLARIHSDARQVFSLSLWERLGVRAWRAAQTNP